MSVALAEPSQAVDAVAAISQIVWNPPRAEASRINGRLSHGPVTPEGKERSRRNGCKEGLTGAGVVLPPAAAMEVARREAEFVRDLRPVNAIERELVRQLALAAWRAREISTRIIAHDARTCAARFARWEQDERIAAAALGRKLGDDPETVVALLQHGSAGCDWLIGRWELLLGGLLAADERASSQGTWSDADLTLALDLLGRPANLRHLDHRAAHLTLLREQARTGSAQAVEELREIIDEEIRRLRGLREELWEEVEKPMLQDWRAGGAIDLGPEGTRLRRYEAAADRLFRSAWTKLERLRNDRGELLMPRVEAEPGLMPELEPEPEPEPSSRLELPKTRPAPIAPVVSAAPLFPLTDDLASILDIWAAGPPRNGAASGRSSKNKTNPARERERERERHRSHEVASR